MFLSPLRELDNERAPTSGGQFNCALPCCWERSCSLQWAAVPHSDCWGQAGKKRRPERVRPNQVAGRIFTFPRQSGGLPKLCEQAFPFLPSMALSRSPKDG